MSSEWIDASFHPPVDVEVIALQKDHGYARITFAHIVDKRYCVDYDGWNIPDITHYIPCPTIPTMYNE